MSNLFRVKWAIILAAGIAMSVSGRSQTKPAATVVFVCEHGSAKSVIAAAHFNRIAESKGLPYRAVSRGVHPDKEIPSNVSAGLLADGIDVKSWKPTLVSDDDFRQAERVVALGCELPRTKSADRSKLDSWDGFPAVGDGYDEARTGIVQRVEALLQELSNKGPSQK